MKNLTKQSACPVNDDKKSLTSFNTEKYGLYVDSGIETIPVRSDRGMTVFLVDDDLLYLTAMKHFLLQEMPSLKIKTFQTGEASLLQMEQHPDIVILDYYLDSKVSTAENGIDILRKIKYLNPDTKVIMLSCQDKIKIAQNSIKHGAFDYVAKGETAFIRIKNILLNVTVNLDVVGKFKKRMQIFKIANIIIITMLILFYLLSH